MNFGSLFRNFDSFSKNFEPYFWNFSPYLSKKVLFSQNHDPVFQNSGTIFLISEALVE